MSRAAIILHMHENLVGNDVQSSNLQSATDVLSRVEPVRVSPRGAQLPSQQGDYLLRLYLLNVVCSQVGDGVLYDHFQRQG